LNKFNNGNCFLTIFLISFTFSLLILFSSNYNLALSQNSNEILDKQLSNPTTNNIVAPIPLGGWNIKSNGVPGTMNITSIDSQGVIQGSILLYPYTSSSTPIKGYYDRNSDKITFIRTIGANPTDVEVYTGYRFSNIIADCIDGTGPGSCYQYSTLAGVFQSFTSNNTIGIPSYLVHSDSNRNTFGWYASHIPEPCPACPQ